MTTSKHSILATIQRHKAEFSSFGVNRIGLFGSYVRNEQTPRSDIDILVDFLPEQGSYDNYMAVYDLLEHLFKKKVEVVTLGGLSPHIGPQILKEVAYA